MTADELPKVYDLPDLAPAPSSDLQALLRRLMEYADWTAARGVMDCLNDDGRHEDARYFREWFARAAQDHVDKPNWLDRGVWQHRCRVLTNTFFFDLFLLDAAIEGLLGSPVTDGPVTDQPMMGPDQWDAGLTAAMDIPVGAAVAVDWDTNTVRVAPNPPAEGGD